MSALQRRLELLFALAVAGLTIALTYPVDQITNERAQLIAQALVSIIALHSSRWLAAAPSSLYRSC